MDDGMKKKLMGAAAAAVAAFMFGGSQIMDMEARMVALEALHPELITEVAAEPAEPAEESTDPAPGEEALKLNEDDEWVPAEETTEEPVEEVEGD
tara:strand:+ start:2522 stop:2806 length:285 start_codon:yes stop_codon:yes gene_type:complete